MVGYNSGGTCITGSNHTFLGANTASDFKTAHPQSSGQSSKNMKPESRAKRLGHSV